MIVSIFIAMMASMVVVVVVVVVVGVGVGVGVGVDVDVGVSMGVGVGVGSRADQKSLARPLTLPLIMYSLYPFNL